MRYGIWLVLLLFMIQGGMAQPLPALIPYYDGKKWGYSDTNGRVKIAPGWKQAAFFKGHTAKVTVADKHFSLIDTSGAYIIPPSRHWNGNWNGPENTALNSRDSNGLYGLIDTNNQVLIPFEWDGPGGQLPAGYSGSFKLVKKKDRYGVIGKDNRLIIPCNYVGIQGREDLLPIQGFLINDPDNTAGTNGQGLISNTGALILPPKYGSIRMIISGTDTLLFCKVSLDNETNGHTLDRWFRYATGKKAEPFDTSNYTLHAQPERTDSPEPFLKNGLLRFWVEGKEGLINAGNDTIVAAGAFYALQGDTLITKTESRSGSDSVLVEIRYRHYATLKTLRPARTVWISQPAERKEMSFNYSFNEREIKRQVNWTYISFGTFYKDSFQFHVTNKIDNTPGAEIFVVAGVAISNNGRNTYYAVVDKELNYLVPPITLAIYHYNRQDDIVTVSGYDRTTGQAGFGLQTAAGEVLMPLQCNNIYEGLRWHGKIFALAAWEPPVPKREATITYSHSQTYYTPDRHFKIVDESGALLPAIKKYYFSYETWSQYRPGFPVYSLYTADGYIYPDGSPVFAKVKGNATLTYVAQDWFAVTRNNQRIMIDTNNTEVLPGFTFDHIQTVLADNAVGYAPAYDPFNRQIFQQPGRLYLVILRNKLGVPFQCYLDDRRKLYGDRVFFQTATPAQKK